MLPQHSVAELAHARTEIAEQIFIAAGDDFDAARIAAEGTPDRERQRLVDKRIDRVSSVRPRVASSASRILPRTATSRNGAGREPRVPQKRTRKDDRKAADALSEVVGDLPLALEHAGAYIDANGITLAD